jgi:CBS domain-containing protein
MNVARIISEKGRNVVTLGEAVSLGDVVATLAEKRIGAVVVVQGADIRGIISERDIVRALAKHGGDVLDRPAADFMTSKVVTCGVDDSVQEVMQKMTAGRFRHLPVVEQNALAGIVSIGDVVKHRMLEVEREAAEIREYIATA